MSSRVYVRKFDHAEAARLYLAGTPGQKIAARFGVTPKAIYDALDALGIERRSRATSVRDGELRCVRCRQWKPDEAFSPDAHRLARRNRKQECRACSVELRTDYRERHKIPCRSCGAPRLPKSEKTAAKNRAHLRDTGLCYACYQASRKVAA